MSETDTTSTREPRADKVAIVEEITTKLNDSVAVFVTDADAPEPSFAGAKFDVVATRTNYTLQLPADATIGRRLWVRACWANERGIAGPASVVTSALIAA